MGKSFHALFTNITLRPISGSFFRAIPAHAADYAVEDGPSYLFNNRYNIPEKFGAIYFGDRAEVCKATLEKRGLLASRRVPYVLLRFDIQVDGILDLTDLNNLKALQIHREDLVQTRGKPGAYDTSQELAGAAYHSAGIMGLYVPDASETGNTLVLYPGRLLAKHFIRLTEKLKL
jgi:hypothetical protein